jgi:hypothetical protein
MHDGAEPEFATFRTSPRGRAPFMFTSFGDQGMPTLGKKFVPPEGVTIKNPPYVNDNLGSPAAGDTMLCRDGGRALRTAENPTRKEACLVTKANCFGSFTVARASTASPVGRKNTVRRLWRCRVVGEMLLLRWMLGLKAGSAMYRGWLPRVRDGA